MSVEIVDGEKRQSTDEHKIRDRQMPNVRVRNCLPQFSILGKAIEHHQVANRTNDEDEHVNTSNQNEKPKKLKSLRYFLKILLKFFITSLIKSSFFIQ